MNKMNYAPSEYKHVASINTSSAQRWYVNMKGVGRNKFDTEREAAIAVDKLLIGRGKEPVNVLTRAKQI